MKDLFRISRRANARTTPLAYRSALSAGVKCPLLPSVRESGRQKRADEARSEAETRRLRGR